MRIQVDGDLNVAEAFPNCSKIVDFAKIVMLNMEVEQELPRQEQFGLSSVIKVMRKSSQQLLLWLYSQVHLKLVIFGSNVGSVLSYGSKTMFCSIAPKIRSEDNIRNGELAGLA